MGVVVWTMDVDSVLPTPCVFSHVIRGCSKTSWHLLNTASPRAVLSIRIGLKPRGPRRPISLARLPAPLPTLMLEPKT